MLTNYEYVINAHYELLIQRTQFSIKEINLIYPCVWLETDVCFQLVVNFLYLRSSFAAVEVCHRLLANGETYDHRTCVGMAKASSPDLMVENDKLTLRRECAINLFFVVVV